MTQSVPSAPTRPSLGSIAESIHHAVVDDPVARVVSVCWDPAQESVRLGFWDVPPGPLHPIDPLVGFVAPTEWDAVGLVSTGRLRRLDTRSGAADQVLTTVLLPRAGEATSTVGPIGGPTQTLEGTPEGLVPDVLSRVLQRPTPPPECSTATLVELTWLDRIATGLLQKHSRGRTWRWLADRHPLRGGGPPPSPEELAGRVSVYAETRTWADLRSLVEPDDLPAATWGPPGGSLASSETWFDDGSLSRWMLRHLPPAEALVADLLSVLPSPVGADLLMALTVVDGTWTT
jgi:hypothetical protein